MLVWHLAQPGTVLTPVTILGCHLKQSQDEHALQWFPAILKTCHAANAPSDVGGKLCSDTSVVCEQLRTQSQYFSCATQQTEQLRQRGWYRFMNSRAWTEWGFFLLVRIPKCGK